MTYDDLPYTRYGTFNEWKELGYGVIKGSKAFWVDGQACFSEFQVRKFVPYEDYVEAKFKETVNKRINELKDDIPF